MRRTKFCPQCGNETDKFYDNLCKNCFLRKIKLEDLPEKIKIIHCRLCGKFFGSEKGEIDFEEAVNYSLSKVLRQREIESATFRIDKDKVYSEIIIESGGLRKNIEVDFDLAKKETMCKFCAQKISGYFNAILQIRGSKSNEVLGEIKTEIERLNKRDSLAFISKVEDFKNGKDIYIGSKSATHKIVSLLKRRYRIKTKISRKQYGIQGGKQVFRDTVLILLSD